MSKDCALAVEHITEKMRDIVLTWASEPLQLSKINKSSLIIQTINCLLYPFLEDVNWFYFVNKDWLWWFCIGFHPDIKVPKYDFGYFLFVDYLFLRFALIFALFSSFIISAKRPEDGYQNFVVGIAPRTFSGIDLLILWWGWTGWNRLSRRVPKEMYLQTPEIPLLEGPRGADLHGELYGHEFQRCVLLVEWDWKSYGPPELKWNIEDQENEAARLIWMKSSGKLLFPETFQRG